MNITEQNQRTQARLQGSSDLAFAKQQNRVLALSLMSWLAPAQPLSMVIYRLGGEVLDRLLRPLLVEARAGANNERAGESAFKNLTATLSNALAPHIDMAWHSTVHYQPLKNTFSDIEVRVLAEHDSPSLAERLVKAVAAWLSDDVLREQLAGLMAGVHEWLQGGVSRETVTLAAPINPGPVAYPSDGRYFQAMALFAAMTLRQDAGVAALLSPRALLLGGTAPKPALRCTSQGVTLMGEPEQQAGNRWLSNVLLIQPRSDIGYGQLSVNVSLHSRVYGDLAPLAAGEAAQARQLLLYQRQDDALILQQYPFVLSAKGARFEQDNATPTNKDWAGASIARLYQAQAGVMAGQIPLQAGQYHHLLVMPLLAQGLGDSDVATYTGATAPERFDISEVVNRALLKHDFLALPAVSLLAQTVARASVKDLLGNSVFRQAALEKDTQVTRHRRELLAEYLRLRGGTQHWCLLLTDVQAAEYPSAGNDWLIALAQWSGLRVTERWTTPELNRVYEFREKNLKNPLRYGSGSRTLFSARSEDGSEIRISAKFQALDDSGDAACQALIDERDWEGHWCWYLHAELLDAVEQSAMSFDNRELELAPDLLPPILIDSPSTLSATLDQGLGFIAPIPAALSARRALIALQLGRKIAIPVLTLRDDLRDVIKAALFDILGPPQHIAAAAAHGECWRYAELDLWLGFWPQVTGDVGLALSSLLPQAKSGAKWRAENKEHGQQRQRTWLRQLAPLREALADWQVLPLVALPFGSQQSGVRDPKPWLRDLFNRIGWMAKFILQSQEAPVKERHLANEWQRIRISLLAQLTNHGVPPLLLSGLLRKQTAITGLASLTVMKYQGEVIPVVWWVNEHSVTQMGLRDAEGGVAWYTPVAATRLLAERDAKSVLLFSRNRLQQQAQAALFWQQLIQQLGDTQTLLLVNGEACRMSFSRFMNRDFMFDRTPSQQLIVVRISATEQAQYFADGEDKSAALKSGFSGFYSHPGSPRRALLLANRGASILPYQRSRLENRFLELGTYAARWPELQPLVSATPTELTRHTDNGQGPQMRRLVECVITDLPVSRQDDTALMQYIHGLVKNLQGIHIEYPESTNLPYPLHELTDFAGDMIKVQPVSGIEVSCLMSGAG